ncbi:MAG: RHS repeat-associated core domain-containing protein, partial [Anaerolinea sp.]|nr:RHS repeat-associated core domain-containing protein [Anaerolinea sp.]
DGLGSVRQEMAGGDLQTTTTYEPYGKLLVQTGTSGTTYGFTGEQEDAATGLVYLRARYYNPSLKVFISRDPFSGWLARDVSGLQ